MTKAEEISITLVGTTHEKTGVKRLVFLQDSITKEFYVDHTSRLGPLSQATIYSIDNYHLAIKSKVDDYNFFLNALGNGKPVWKVHFQGIERKKLPLFGIVPITTTIFVNNTIEDYQI